VDYRSADGSVPLLASGLVEAQESRFLLLGKTGAVDMLSPVGKVLLAGELAYYGGTAS
jgi:hypothetical protein